jgi:hypothetical protein
MFKTVFLATGLFLSSSSAIFCQCLSALPPPDCTGADPLVMDNETLSGGTTKWYYGPTVTMNSLTLKGGTLVVCGNLTIDKFYMETGTIFIRPGAHFVIGSGIGEGLIFRGDCAIYNYGSCEIQRNLSLDNGATALKPNRVINATSTSVFKMSNQYFVIGNANSWFVNNGSAECWGIITDNQSAANSICLGDGSSTRMAVLINKVADTYVVPVGSACVNVYQFSQFFSRLTNSHNLYACLGSTHTSDAGCIAFGCLPNNWGAARVFTNCAACLAITVLEVQFSSVSATATPAGTVDLDWDARSVIPGNMFSVLRSADGISYRPLYSLRANGDNIHFTITDKNPLKGPNYYMIRYFNPSTGYEVISKAVKAIAGKLTGFLTYPVPFNNRFLIDYAAGSVLQKVMLTDIAGHNINIRYAIREESHQVEVMVLDKIQPDIYIVHLLTNKQNVSKTIVKK